MADSSLPSWNDTATKDAIPAFVEGVTSDGPRFVPPADRIATFDNDGTLWVEQPMPPQFMAPRLTNGDDPDPGRAAPAPSRPSRLGDVPA